MKIGFKKHDEKANLLSSHLMPDHPVEQWLELKNLIRLVFRKEKKGTINYIYHVKLVEVEFPVLMSSQVPLLLQ